MIRDDQKVKYEPPTAEPLHDEDRSLGDCESGSGDFTVCRAGNGAYNIGCDGGSSPAA